MITKNPLIKCINMKEEEHIDDNALVKLKKMSEFATLVDNRKIDARNKKSVNFLRFSKRNAAKNLNFDKLISGNLFGSALKTDMFDDGFKKKDEERIVIDDETYLKSDVDLISKAVLKRCNYFHEKNKNSTKGLKKGEGKLMFTNGMTVSEFIQKFNNMSSQR